MNSAKELCKLSALFQLKNISERKMKDYYKNDESDEWYPNINEMSEYEKWQEEQKEPMMDIWNNGVSHVAGLVIIKDNKQVLVSKHTINIEVEQKEISFKRYGLLGGILNNNEEPKEGLKREIYEETGNKYLVELVNHAIELPEEKEKKENWDLIIHTFIVKIQSSTKAYSKYGKYLTTIFPESDGEVNSLRWIPVEAILKVPYIVYPNWEQNKREDWHIVFNEYRKDKRYVIKRENTLILHHGRGKREVIKFRGTILSDLKRICKYYCVKSENK